MITGSVLAEAILQWLSTHGLSPADIRGQCYDGASNMSGGVSGLRPLSSKTPQKHCIPTVLLIA